MEHLPELIQHFGYYVVFIGTLLEGELIVALAGYAVFQGHLHAIPLFLVAVTGATLGDHFYFFLGRVKGRTYLKKRPVWHDRAEKIHSLVERHQNLVIFGSRFLYGFRAVTPIVLGTSKVSVPRFMTLNILGAIVWATFFIFGGYTFGGAIEQFIGRARKVEIIFAVAVLAIALILIGFNRFIARKQEKIFKEEHDRKGQ